MPLCGPHDRWKHANHIRSRRATSGRLFLIKPDGTTVLPIGAREPDWAEPPPRESPIEPLQLTNPTSNSDPRAHVGDTVDYGEATVTIHPHPDAAHLYWFDGQDLQQYRE